MILFKQKIQKWFNRGNRLVIIALVMFLAFSITYTVFADPPTSKYLAGATLDPACLPGATNCSTYPIAIGGGVGLATAGSVLFAGTGGVLTQDNPRFFYDNSEGTLYSGNLSLTASLLLPATTTGGVGIIYQNGSALVHTYKVGATNNNFFAGVGAGSFSITSSTNANVGVGGSALSALTSGTANTALGYRSMQYGTTASDNTAIGMQSLRNATTTASENVAIGESAMYGGSGIGTLVGIKNVAVGNTALYGIVSGSNNVSIGHRSGLSVETGSNNILVGYQAGDNITTGSNNIVLGYDLDAVSGTGSNQLNIGNALYGNLATGNLGIGQTTPTARLHVKGSGTTSATSSLLVTNSTPTTVFEIKDDGTFALGLGANAGGSITNTTIGTGAVNNGTYGIAIGNGVSASTNSIAIGSYSTGSNSIASTAIGILTSATSWGAWMLGGHYNSLVTNDISGSLKFASTSGPSSDNNQSLFVAVTGNQVFDTGTDLRASNINTHMDYLAENAITIANASKASGTGTVTSVSNSGGSAVFTVSSAITGIAVGDKVTLSGFGVYSNTTYYYRSVTSTTFTLHTTRNDASTDTAKVAYISTDAGTVTPYRRAPGQTLTDAVQYYTDDIAAGEASPFWLTENGAVIGLGSSKFGLISNHNLNLTVNNTIGATLLASSGNFGIGITNPAARLNIKGAGTSSATKGLLIQNSSAQDLLSVNDEGFASITGRSADRTVLSIDGTEVGSGNSTLIAIKTNGTIAAYLAAASTSPRQGLFIGAGSAGTGSQMYFGTDGTAVITSGENGTIYGSYTTANLTGLYNQQTPLVLVGTNFSRYRDVNTVNYGFIDHYYLNNTSSNRTEYGNQTVAIADNTAGAESGYFTWSTRSSGLFDERLRLTSSGELVIGNGDISTTPVSGVLRATSALGTNVAGASLTFAGGKATGNGVGGSLIFQTSDAGASGTTLQSLSTKATLLASGNFGIGDTTPASMFTVGSGDLFQVDSSGLVATPDGGATRPAYSFTGDTDTGMYHSSANVLDFATAGVKRLEIDFDGNILMPTADYGDGTAPPFLSVGRNSNATNTAAGSINFVSKGGTAGYVWQDNAGNLRIHTATPSNANDTAGTVVGTQTSTRDTKQDITDYTDYNAALMKVLQAPLHSFRYSKEVEGYGADSPLAKYRLGYIADEVDPLFMWGNVIDQVSVNGIVLASIKALDLKIEPLTSLDLNITGSFANLIKQYLEDITNGLAKIFVGEVHTNTLCVGATCVTESQLQQLLNNQNGGSGASTSGETTSGGTTTDTTGDGSTTGGDGTSTGGDTGTTSGGDGTSGDGTTGGDTGTTTG